MSLQPASLPASSPTPAGLSQPEPQTLALSGAWTALQLGDMPQTAAAWALPAAQAVTLQAQQLQALDSAGAWVLQTLLLRLRAEGHNAKLVGLPAPLQPLLDDAAAYSAAAPDHAKPQSKPEGLLARLGRHSTESVVQWLAVLALLGQLALALSGWFMHPRRWRWRPVLFNIRSAGVDALPIVGLLALLMGMVVAYQSADQLRQFGANIFIVDVVGLSMLREFAPMVTAIIVAGRSGSAYAAQIGTMAVTEEIDAMRTLGMEPLEVLVLPKLLALLVALPLLTLFADVMGVLGGMVSAWAVLDVGFHDFMARFTKAVSVTAFLVGLGKAPVFALIIVVIGCFQGLQTRGGADSVGRNTTRSVVQSIFLVIVADALFSIVFSTLDL